MDKKELHAWLENSHIPDQMEYLAKMVRRSLGAEMVVIIPELKFDEAHTFSMMQYDGREDYSDEYQSARVLRLCIHVANNMVNQETACVKLIERETGREIHLPEPIADGKL